MSHFQLGLTPGQFELFLLPEIHPADRTLKESLNDYYSIEENFCIDESGVDRGAEFPDGTPWFSCTNWALYVRRLEGKRAKLYGFDDDENPHSRIALDAGGHEFAVFDDRFIIDGWVVNVSGYAKRAVFDLRDPGDAEDIWHLYGPPKFWLDKCRDRALEQHVDGESVEFRKRALTGIAPRTNRCAN